MSPEPSAGHDTAPSLLPAIAALVGGAIAMGASTVFVRIAWEEGVGPFASAFWRSALALPFLLAWTTAEGGATQRRGLGPVALAGALFAGDLFFWHLALLATTVANATFLATTAPVWIVVATVLVGRRGVPRESLAGLALCLAGGALLVGQSYGFAPERLRGDLYGVLTAVFFAGTILAIGRARRSLPPARVALLSTAVTAAMLFAAAVLLEERLAPAGARGWAALVALAFFSQVAGQGLLTVALGRLPAMFSSLVVFLEAVAAALAAWIVLGEALGVLQLAGGLSVLAGIWVARPRAARR